MIRRSPDGKFCDPWFALDAWLPRLMDQARQSTVFSVVLKSLALRCVNEAGSEYGCAAKYCSGNEPSRSPEYTLRKHEAAQRWFAKRDILLKALRDIEATDATRF